jgi:hypothetical protein
MALYRTFVKLDEHEREILKNLRQLLRQPNGQMPPQTAVLRGMIRDYWSRLKQDRDSEISDTCR